jgi:ketosteroid isomerase-like protein
VVRKWGTVVRSAVCGFVVFLSPSLELAGQAPGYPSVPIGQVRAEYVAEVIVQVNEVLADWGDHWVADQVDDLVDMYWEDALFIAPDGVLRRGSEELRIYFSDALPSMGRVEAFMLDFDASGGMSQVFGNYTLEVDGVQTSGPMLTVYVRRGRDWKIRSQVFIMPS